MTQDQSEDTGNHNTAAAQPSERRELRASVLRLLRHAIQEAVVGIDSDFVNKVVPVLSKDERNLNDEDEKTLWLAYQVLSKAILPASDESLRLKEHIDQEDWNHATTGQDRATGLVRAYKNSYRRFKFLLWAVGLLYLVLQGYALLLSSLIDSAEQQRTELITIDSQILTVRQANPDMGEDKSPLRELIYKREWIQTRLTADNLALQRISFPWGELYTYDEALASTHKSGQALQLNVQLWNGPAMHSFRHGAKSVLNILNYLILPTVLGFMGSLAYVIRGILDSFSSCSITLGSRRRWETRVSLGGLLGLITGAVFAPGLEEFDKMKISPMVWAFLMGYSVEFAFSIFDTLIERGRETITAVKDKTTKDLPPIPPTTEPTPAEKPAGTS